MHGWEKQLIIYSFRPAVQVSCSAVAQTPRPDPQRPLQGSTNILLNFCVSANKPSIFFDQQIRDVDQEELDPYLWRSTPVNLPAYLEIVLRDVCPDHVSVNFSTPLTSFTLHQSRCLVRSSSTYCLRLWHSGADERCLVKSSSTKSSSIYCLRLWHSGAGERCLVRSSSTTSSAIYCLRLWLSSGADERCLVKSSSTYCLRLWHSGADERCLVKSSSTKSSSIYCLRLWHSRADERRCLVRSSSTTCSAIYCLRLWLSSGADERCLVRISSTYCLRLWHSRADERCLVKSSSTKSSSISCLRLWHSGADERRCLVRSSSPYCLRHWQSGADEGCAKAFWKWSEAVMLLCIKGFIADVGELSLGQETNVLWFVWGGPWNPVTERSHFFCFVDTACPLSLSAFEMWLTGMVLPPGDQQKRRPAYAAGAFHYEVISKSLSRHLGENFQVDDILGA